jgi:hypothetical protein
VLDAVIDAGALLVADRSARSSTVRITKELVLSPGFGSVVGLPATTLVGFKLTSVNVTVGGGTVTVSVAVWLAPL